MTSLTHDDSKPRPTAVTLPAAADWYRDAVIYQVHVRAFFDSNDDGIGDFVGLARKLDYIQSLGVSAIWLLPFYPSPLKDDGYDIADYRGVHPSYGTRRDFLAFLDAAHERGLRVITELVINHTSDQHPWFQAARRAKRGSSKRDFYVWSDTDQKYPGVPIVFKDTEPSNWTWDPVAGQYFWHRFFRHQPDLNFDNATVRASILKIMRFWMDMGVDGMRLDAVPYLIEREGTQCANLPETHAFLKEIRRTLDTHYEGRMLLAEANQWPSDVRAYFGDGDECHMAFHFPLMPRLYMALRQEDRHPLSEILYQMPDIPESCQWAIFLRNHDELTLEMVSDEERDYMYQTYAADPQMRLNAGIRRRLAPLLENSRPRIELMTGLLLSLPGTPIVYYGDELGMGDNVYLGDRNGVRTPMQWSDDRNGGFSRADPARLYAPPIMDPVYGFSAVNVEAQERSPHSLLAWMRKTIALRQQHVTFGRGAMELLRPANRRVFAFIRRHEEHDPILVVANLSRTVQAVSLDLARLAGLIPVEMSGGVELPRITDAPYPLTLGPYAFYWLRLQRQAPSTGPQSHVAVESEQAPLLLGPEWHTLLDGSVRHLLERSYLPSFFTRQPWFETRASALARVAVVDWGTVRDGLEPVFIVVCTVTFADGVEARYVVPLALTADADGDRIAQETPEYVVAGIAGARKGVMHARLDGPVGRLLVQAMMRGESIRLRAGRLDAARLPAFDSLALPGDVDALAPAPIDHERFHSYAAFGERVMLKLVRRVWPGVSPEVEVEDVLTRHTAFSRVAAPIGALDYRDATAGSATVALLHAFVPRQTNGWRHMLDDLDRFFDVARTLDPPAPGPVDLAALWTTPVAGAPAEALSVSTHIAATLGARVGELHTALGSDAAAARFGVATLDDAALVAWATRARATWDSLDADIAALTAAGDARAGVLTAVQHRREDAMRVIEDARVSASNAGGRLMRIHGSLDLAHVLVYEGDVSFIGLADDWTMTPGERRALRSPLEDIAGLLYSLRSAADVALATRMGAQPQDNDRLTTWAAWWVAQHAASVLAGYRAAVDASLLPRESKAIVTLTRALVLEQAIETVRRRIGARPQWLELAVAGLDRALGAPIASA